MKDEFKTPDMCLLATKHYPYCIEYVPKELQIPEICLDVVKKDGILLKHIEKQSSEICLEAVKQNGLALKYAKFKTLELCKMAVRQNRGILDYMEECLGMYFVNDGLMSDDVLISLYYNDYTKRKCYL